MVTIDDQVKSCEEHSVEEYTLRFTQQELSVIEEALMLAILHKQEDVLWIDREEMRNHFAQTIHQMHVLKGYVSSFGMEHDEWSYRASFEKWRDNDKRERFY